MIAIGFPIRQLHRFMAPSTGCMSTPPPRSRGGRTGTSAYGRRKLMRESFMTSMTPSNNCRDGCRLSPVLDVPAPAATALRTHALLICIFLGSIGVVPLHAQCVDESVLALGDPAPAFTATQFVQGAPFDSIALGTIHVLEFSGTACKPCIRAIPTMEALQKKYGQAVFVSVFSGESPADVRAF